MNRIFSLTFGVRSCYQCFKVVYEQGILLTVAVRSCFPCFKVVYEQGILTGSWIWTDYSYLLLTWLIYVHVINVLMSFMNISFVFTVGVLYVHIIYVLGRVWTGYSHWQLEYVHVINVFMACMNRVLLFTINVHVRSCYQFWISYSFYGWCRSILSLF